MLKPGEKITKRYVTIRKIGNGGMGEVWECEDLVLKRKVAIKIVNETYSKEDPDAIKILRDEAQLGSTLLGFSNIVTILDFGLYKPTDNDTPTYFIVMELIEGITLDSWIKKECKAFDKETTYYLNLFIAWETCKAIGYAHQKDILHRDIKPLNIFLSTNGSTKIGDFGLARYVEAVTRTHTKWQFNTPAYCSPEQWRGEKPTVHSEVYQIACTLYHLFTGSLPHNADNLVALMYAHLNNDPISIEKVNPVISKELSKAIMDGFIKDPSNRVALWEICDTIATEISGIYTMIVDVHKDSLETQELVGKITEFSQDALAKGSLSFDFPDFSEALSEGLQLALAGIKNIEIRKKVQASQEEVAADKSH